MSNTVIGGLLNMTETLNAMEEALNNTLDVKVGDLVQGEVLTIQDNKQVIVGIIDAGVEGVVPAKELSATTVEQISDIVKIGDVLELVVISNIKDKENGHYLLSKRRVDARKVWEDIEAKFNADEIVEGTVTDVVRGGLVVDLGVRAFVPASLVAERFVKDLSAFKGQTLTFKIVECSPTERKLILSRKAILEAEENERLDKVFSQLQVGDVVEGTVARLAQFGAFIDLGGVDGLVHISELAHTHVKRPSDVLSVGQTVSVKVLELDRESKRISLSVKETTLSPWEVAAEELSEGQAVKGTVKRLADFGAFVEVLPGVEGLLHISQIAHEHVAVPHDVLAIGQEIDVKIIELRLAEQRLSLSMKALIEKPVAKVEEVEMDEDDTYDVEDANVTVTLGDVIGEDLNLED